MAKKKAKSDEKKVAQEEIKDTNVEVEVEEAEANTEVVEEKPEVEEDKISVLEATIKDLNDKHLRLYSEFDNFRKRTMKEKLELSKTASEKVITSLLPVWDDFERAQKHFEDNTNLETFKEGIDLISAKFFNVLKQAGLEAIDSTNTEFNTDEHEAITKIPAPSDDMKGKVIDTTQKGYKLNDKVIRFSQVVVGS